MNITVIGTGYVGLIAGLGFASFGNKVICLDVIEEKIAALKNGKCPIYEPGAEELLQKNMKEGRIDFTTDVKSAIEFGEAIFIAVGTPEDENGDANLSYVYKSAEQIGMYMNDNKVVVDKSTVPIGTSRQVKDVICKELEKRNVEYEVSVASNPEFLREGKAIGDFMNPDRVVLGVADDVAEKKLRKIYRVFEHSKKQIIVTTPETAEMIKYASNAFLATKITFINEIANLCDEVGANVIEVAKAMGADGRISPKFLHPGPGYGGSCFPKDTKALATTGRKMGVPMTLVESVIEANEKQKEIAAEKIIKAMPEGGTIAILGLAFKPETDDMREAPSITIINRLVGRKNFKIKVFDPQAMETAKTVLPNEALIWCDNVDETIEGVDAIAIVTEWAEFRNLEGEYLNKVAPNSKIFDFRHVFDRNDIMGAGLEYFGMGF